LNTIATSLFHSVNGVLINGILFTQSYNKSYGSCRAKQQDKNCVDTSHSQSVAFRTTLGP